MSSGGAMKFNRKTLYGDIFLVLGLISFAYSYSIVLREPAELSVAEQLLLMSGFLSMLIHYFWMLYAVGKSTIGAQRLFWWITIGFTFFFGSYLFYLKIYRRKLVQSC